MSLDNACEQLQENEMSRVTDNDARRFLFKWAVDWMPTRDDLRECYINSLSAVIEGVKDCKNLHPDAIKACRALAVWAKLAKVSAERGMNEWYDFTVKVWRRPEIREADMWFLINVFCGGFDPADEMARVVEKVEQGKMSENALVQWADAMKVANRHKHELWSDPQFAHEFFAR